MKIICLVFIWLICFEHSNSQKPYAVIAGGSKGIGYALAEALAKRDFNLLLIARHEAGLQQAKSLLEKTYAIDVQTLALDLADTISTGKIKQYCIDNHLPVKVLCNVAGLGGAHDFGTLPLDSLRYMIRLNIESVMALCLVMIPLLEQQQPAYILNVASMAGFAPIPSKNMYSATKAAVISFSYGLRYQLQEKNISVTYLAPGPVFTKPEIRDRTKKELIWFGMLMARPPAKVGEKAIRKTLAGKMVVVPGFIANVSSGVLRLLPKRWTTSIYTSIKSG